ncbi:MAG: PTPA-CTERM sorting domain-containing protein [Phycisphaeraceae bacterium]
MNAQWIDRLRLATAVLTVAALGPAVMAQPATDVSASRSVSTEGIVFDGPEGGPSNNDSDSTTSTAPTGLFDESVQIHVVAPNGSAELRGHAGQVSNIEFLSPDVVHMTGTLDIDNLFQGLPPSGPDEFAELHMTSSANLGFEMTTELPVIYDMKVDYDFDFSGSPALSEAQGFVSAFDVIHEFGLGGFQSLNVSGQVPAGAQDVSLGIIHGMFDFLTTGETRATGSMNFDITARIVPTPAAVGPGLMLLGGLLLRRRRPTCTHA